MRNRFLFSLSLLLTVQLSAQTSADAVARRAIDTLAGEAWEKARYLAFTFNVERDGNVAASFPQKWDRYTGQYRVTGKNPQGETFDVVMNINTKEGSATLNGAPVAEPKELLALGYRRFINDTYWLLMPLKSMDPGVRRESAGEKKDDCGRTLDGVKLSFDSGVGLTPGDVYWMWVNRDTGLVDEWHMRLQSAKPEDAPGEVVFRNYKRIGGLLLSTRREYRGRNVVIRLDDVEVRPDVPAGAFSR